MIPGLSGTLLSEDALEQALPDALRGLLGERERARAGRRIRTWHAALRRVLGPSAGPRTIFDRLAVPFFAQLGYRVSSGGVPSSPSSPASPLLSADLEMSGRKVATLVVTGWGQDPGSAWRHGVRQGIGNDLRWCFCLTGDTLRIVDSLRTYSRRYVQFELEMAIDQEKTFNTLWGLLRAAAMNGTAHDSRPLLERAIEISESHRASVRSSLQAGVHEALFQLTRAFTSAARRKGSPRAPSVIGNTFNESLIVIYRVLFLLFAEARGLVPGWHPVYRDGYTIESLRRPVEVLPRPRGLWETIQSIARLAHRGCRIGQLQVTPFNGRLFSPIESPLADSVSLDDGAVRQALLALTTRATRSGRQRIAYADLGVEQLGGVYEGVLDVEPSTERSPRTKRRKATGTFYTPRSLTECLIRRTLAPLVVGRTAEEILQLRVLDPAMGSGAFLVAACRYLAAAYETALRAENALAPDEIDEPDRADFRRTIAQQCLYGVDINPMAVQLGRLSLWLATLAADRPLTFLDHRLRAGNSLVGASLADLARPPRGAARSARGQPRPLPLFDDPESDEQLRRVVAARHAIAVEPGNTLAQVRAKEDALAGLLTNAALSRWKEGCDLWCSHWFDTERAVRNAFPALIDSVFERPTLPDRVVAPLRARARTIASHESFFHWTLEFPEVFVGADSGVGSAGFDAVIGNPPWEVLRADCGDGAGRRAARCAVSMMTAFARGSGIYSLQGLGHPNLYQLFLERMLRLLKPRRRIGVVLPSGLGIDQGGAALRRALLRTTRIDTLISIDNRGGIFPIHRGLKFILLTATTNDETTALPCRFGVTHVEELDRLPDVGRAPDTVLVPRTLVETFSGEALAVPDVRAPVDVDILSQLACTLSALGSREGWSISFGRELNATDDKEHFVSADDARGLPVVEGKLLAPFVVNVHAARFRISRRTAARLLDPERTFRRARLAYRDVAAPTNRLTLIAAIVPKETVTTHTLFCLKEDLIDDCQWFLCGMFNSFVANYLVRMSVGTHVTTAIIERLPMPKPNPLSAGFHEIVELSRALAGVPGDAARAARLQALAAHLYGLNRLQFDHVLSTFPLVPRAERDRVLAAFCDIVA
jgi:N-6 DNA Methylase/Eco57I restriction-modification methylase